jgi:hypothetical protein
MAASNNGKRPVGPPKGSRNNLSHGVLAFRNQVKRRVRRGRNVIDRRTQAGKNAIAIQAALTADLGGADKLPTAKLVLVELIGRDVYFLDEMDKRIVSTINQANKELPNSGTTMKQRGTRAKLLSILYSYRQSAANNLAKNLLALGLEKAPPRVKSRDELLAEDEETEPKQEGE